jgi:hypothetical protein
MRFQFNTVALMVLPSIAEVLIAPSALHIDAVKSALRPDVAVAIQDIHTAKVSGASSGT